jgi:hypothetical protein
VTKAKQRLSQIEKVQKIEKILGSRWRSFEDDQGILPPKAIVEAEIFNLEVTCAAQKRIKSRWSNKRAIEQFVSALHKANRPIVGLPEDLCLLLGLDQMIYMLEAYKKVSQKPQPDAYEKRAAAHSAKRLCEKFGIKPRTTRKTPSSKPSVFCQLSAVLYGDDTDMQHYCREAISAKPKQK